MMFVLRASVGAAGGLQIAVTKKKRLALQTKTKTKNEKLKQKLQFFIRRAYEPFQATTSSKQPFQANFQEC